MSMVTTRKMEDPVHLSVVAEAGELDPALGFAGLNWAVTRYHAVDSEGVERLAPSYALRGLLPRPCSHR